MIFGLSIGLGNPLRCSTEFQSYAQMMTLFPCLTEESYDSATVRRFGIKAAYITPLTTDSGLQFLINYLSLDSDDGQAHVDEYVRASYRASRQTGVVSSPQMGGFVILLEVWFYEYFCAANPILTEYTNERPRLRA
ncbi:hypothetical protein IFM89_038646 [Coptis chinensis]|uniref:Aminotransferase-like plant mobile domain-containing protein n=1 Tax=Coptis chinensis TaxID=261450 RepID=A0A835I7X4_9MAGN|nr:hypothetical protein IFM89_038646 [Coptis chinensis]